MLIDSTGIWSLRFLNRNMFLHIFLPSVLPWVFQLCLESISRPKNFTDSWKFDGVSHFRRLNNRFTFFFTFAWSLFSSNHLKASDCAYSFTSLADFPSANLFIKVVSSAYKMQLDVKDDGKSLINIRKRRGPIMEPWGTPLSIGRCCEVSSLNFTTCILFSR